MLRSSCCGAGATQLHLRLHIEAYIEYWSAYCSPFQRHMGSFTFLDHDPLQKGIPVPQKMAFFGSATIASPQILYSLLILLQRYLELLDVFCAPFPKRCLCLAISLFPFFRGSIYLDGFA